MLVGPQAAVIVHVPVPLIIVTSAVAGLTPCWLLIVHTPAVPLIVGAMPALVVAVTVNWAPFIAVAGAPVKLTVGVANVAAVVWVAVAARKTASAAQLAVSKQLPVPLVIVTVAEALAGVPVTAPTVQTPVGVMVGIVLALVVAVTVNWPL